MTASGFLFPLRPTANSWLPAYVFLGPGYAGLHDPRSGVRMGRDPARRRQRVWLAAQIGIAQLKIGN
jgi:hypothetical protein